MIFLVRRFSGKDKKIALILHIKDYNQYPETSRCYALPYNIETIYKHPAVTERYLKELTRTIEFSAGAIRDEGLVIQEIFTDYEAL
jgi:hypothetical protein